MQTNTIQELDSIYSVASRDLALLLAKPLSYESSYWRQGPYRKERTSYNKLVIGRDGYFLSGFRPRVKEYLDRISRPVIWLNSVFPLRTFMRPYVDGMDLRLDQIDFVGKAIVAQRGIILAPTGTGKTVVIMALLSCYPHSRSLYLCHKQDLITQTKQEMVSHGFRVTSFWEQEKDLTGQIVVATRQSLAQASPQDYADRFDIVCIDEAHYVSDFAGDYATILKNVVAPIRLGFTATMPTHNPRAMMAMEGFLGRVIGTLPLEQAQEDGILVPAHVRIVKVPYPSDFAYQLGDTSFKRAYQFAIVNNRSRHRIVLQEVNRQVRKGFSTLILVKEKEHGYQLQKIAREAFYLDVPFVCEDMGIQQRELVKKDFTDKKTMVVITALVWREGINIRSLGSIVDAAARGKTELGLLQSMGRGLRTFEGKEFLEIVDFFDSCHWKLVEHFGERISLYCEKGWF